ncbi:MAG: alpha/beta fold hydrolase [Anaerolineales bacterium]|nr:alpha/beta fold hydrolase [Anaerolineales bacterium]
MKKKAITYTILGLIAVLFVGLAGFVIWANDTNPVMETALNALESDTAVTVTQTPWITFTPTGETAATGVVFYPGGKVDARAYAPLMRGLAEAGYLTIITPMPLNLAFTNANAIEDVIAAHPEIEQWVISGHSLGGAMAANYAYTHPDILAGLILYGSYPADNNSLADQNLPVLSIYGTEDGGADKIAQSGNLLPPQAQLVVIEGGNHAQFGDYGLQKGDGTAVISRADQQAQTLQVTLDFLASLQP